MNQGNCIKCGLPMPYRRRDFICDDCRGMVPAVHLPMYDGVLPLYDRQLFGLRWHCRCREMFKI